MSCPRLSSLVGCVLCLLPARVHAGGGATCSTAVSIGSLQNVTYHISALFPGPALGFGCAKAIAQRGVAPQNATPLRSQRQLVARLVEQGKFSLPGDPDTSHAVLCMNAIDRRHFAPSAPEADVYADTGLHLPHTMMSAPNSKLFCK